MNMQPNNKNWPLVQQTLLTPYNGQAALYKWMLMYCDKPLTTDKRCGYTKISVVVLLSWSMRTHVHLHARPAMLWRLTLRCGNMIGWLARTESTVMGNLMILEPGWLNWVLGLQICHCCRLGEQNGWSSAYIPCISNYLTDFKNGLTL